MMRTNLARILSMIKSVGADWHLPKFPIMEALKDAPSFHRLRKLRPRGHVKCTCERARTKNRIVFCRKHRCYIQFNGGQFRADRKRKGAND